MRIEQVGQVTPGYKPALCHRDHMNRSSVVGIGSRKAWRGEAATKVARAEWPQKGAKKSEGD
jgi:hypothetical protein